MSKEILQLETNNKSPKKKKKPESQNQTNETKNWACCLTRAAKLLQLQQKVLDFLLRTKLPETNKTNNKLRSNGLLKGSRRKSLFAIFLFTAKYKKYAKN